MTERKFKIMSREEFIEQLKRNLSGLPESDLNEAIDYYSEYLSEVPDEKLSEVIEKLGKPEYIANQIKSESGYGNPNVDNKNKKSSNLVFRIILVVVLSPIWLSLFIAYASLIISVIVVIVSVYLVFPISFLCSVVSVIGTMTYGICFSLLYGGIGLFSIGVSIMLFKVAVKGVKAVSALFVKSVSKLYRVAFKTV